MAPCSTLWCVRGWGRRARLWRARACVRACSLRLPSAQGGVGAEGGGWGVHPAWVDMWVGGVDSREGGEEGSALARASSHPHHPLPPCCTLHAGGAPWHLCRLLSLAERPAVQGLVPALQQRVGGARPHARQRQRARGGGRQRAAAHPLCPGACRPGLHAAGQWLGCWGAALAVVPALAHTQLKAPLPRPLTLPLPCRAWTWACAAWLGPAPSW